MRIWLTYLLSAVALLSGCGSANGPLATRSFAITTPLIGAEGSQSHHHQRLVEHALRCIRDRGGDTCEREGRRAMPFVCGEIMEARVFAYCNRCVYKQSPDDRECRDLARLMIVGPEYHPGATGSDVSGLPPPTHDPIGAPRPGPPPPLRK